MIFTKTDIARVARNANIEWYNQGQMARFDLRILTGDYETIELCDEYYHNDEKVARFALFNKLCNGIKEKGSL